jgi:hypothetical protein
MSGGSYAPCRQSGVDLAVNRLTPSAGRPVAGDRCRNQSDAAMGHGTGSQAGDTRLANGLDRSHADV